MAYSNPNIPTVNIITMDPVSSLVIHGECTGVPPAGTTYAGIFALRCLMTDVAGTGIYEMTGTVANPAWTAISYGAAGSVTLASLAAGIAPSHVVKYAGKITWSGSGASLATTVTGVLATDIVLVTIQSAPTQAAYIKSATPTTDTVTIALSAANTSNDAVIAYQVLRAAV